MKTKVFKLGVLIGFFVLIFGPANLWAEEESPTASADKSYQPILPVDFMLAL